jgi:hypothetical protein
VISMIVQFIMLVRLLFKAILGRNELKLRLD